MASAMISPVVNTTPQSQTAKAEQYCDLGCVNLYALGQNGVIVVPWAITFGRATDWAAAEADAEIEFLFPIPGDVNTPAELKAFLRGATINDLSVPLRTNLQAVFDNHGINRADFTLATTGAQVMKRLLAALWEQDFESGWEFIF